MGGGPAGNTCATVAATLGADVTLIERDIVGGAAHLWDCIPSKALIATGGELVELDRAHTMGLKAEGRLDIEALRERVSSIEGRLHQMITTQLASQQVRVIHGHAELKGPHEVVVDTNGVIEELAADYVVLATGSRPRIPDFVPVDHERVLTTRDAYPPPEIPEHAIVVGSGVTGVEFTHLFDSLGSKVTLLVSGRISAPPGPRNRSRDLMSVGSRHRTGRPTGAGFFLLRFFWAIAGATGERLSSSSRACKIAT